MTSECVYRVSVCQKMNARHCFPDSRDPGERKEHEHHYRVKLTVESDILDEWGYVVDITVLRETLRRILDTFNGTLLNGHPQLHGDLPSIENLARSICGQLGAQEDVQRKAAEVTITEEDDSSATCREERSCE